MSGMSYQLSAFSYQLSAFGAPRSDHAGWKSGLQAESLAPQTQYSRRDAGQGVIQESAWVL